MLESTFTDGLLVLHDGVVLFEYYAGAMKPSDTHLLMSVSKSLTSTLCGVFVERGLVKPEGAVVDYIEELRGTAWEGCTVQHLLDMRAGTRWDYEEDEVKICDVSDYRTHSRRDIPPDTASWIRSIENSHEHGGPFRYVSLESDVLGWVLERAGGGRFADLFSREIWSAIGAERDAEIVLDNSGFSIVEGGICTTLRDLGRFGQLCLQGGELSGRQLVPADWLGRLRVRDRELIDAYADFAGIRRRETRRLLPRQLVDLRRGAWHLLGPGAQRAGAAGPSPDANGGGQVLLAPRIRRPAPLRPAGRRDARTL